jgi:peptidyl-prolyl cis-trans isomerase C
VSRLTVGTILPRSTLALTPPGFPRELSMLRKFFPLRSLLTIGLLAASALWAATSYGVVPQSNPVVAIVNGLQITRTDLLTEQQYLPPNLRGRPFAANYDVLLNRMIDLVLLSEEAERLEMPSEPEVRRRIELARKRVLRDALMDRNIAASVTEEKMRAEYAAVRQREDFAFEEVRVRHIVLRTQEEALEVIAEFTNGADFAKLAKQRSIDPSAARGGDLGYFRQGEVDPAFAQAVFDMEVGPVSPTPINTQFGWHVVQKTDHRTVEPTFEAVAPALHQRFAGEASNGLIRSLRETAKVQTFNPDGTARK